MRPSRENVFSTLARLEQSGCLPQDGPVSVFIAERIGAVRMHPTQIAVKIQGDTVYARFTRLPFVRPYVYSRQALKTAVL